MASAVLASRNETNWSTTTSTSAAHHQQQQSSQRSFSNNNNNNNKNNYMGKFPPFGNPNPNQNNFNNHHHQHNLNNSRKQFSHQLLNGAVEELIPGDAASFNRNNRRDSDVGVAGVPFSRYVSFDISAYSKSDLRKLKSQLMSELDKVRILSCRIDTGDVVNRSVSKKRSSPFPPTNGNTNKEPKRSAPNGRQQQQQQQPPQQPQPPPYVASAQVMKSCGTVLKKLSTQKSSIWFNTPVDVVGMGLHDYHTVINRPMDLGTIKDKLDRRVYDSPEDFAADVRLTFNNALRYNPKGHEVNTIAGQYLALFEKWFPPILAKYQSEKQLHFQQMVPRKNPISNPPVPKPVKEDFSVVDDEVQGSSWSKFPSPDPPKMFNPVKRPDPKPVTPPPPPPPVCAPVPVPVPVAEPMPVQMPIPVPMPMRTPTPRREPSPVVAPAVDKSSGGGSGRGRKSEGKLPKPKAKDPNKRGMTMEEKHKLGAGLQSLPEEKMSQVIQIIRKRNGDLTQDGDEIELDIEAVDTETLWELDRFVTNYKKMVSKIQRQALLPVRNNAGGFSDDTNQAGMSDRMMMDTPSKPKKGGVVGGGGGGDGDVAEEDVDIGDEMPVNNFPPLEIDKDDDRQQGGDHSDSSSSSGSSSDDSSSSDSDSGSSSGSDSDVDDAQSRDNGSKNFHH